MATQECLLKALENIDSMLEETSEKEIIIDLLALLSKNSLSNTPMIQMLFNSLSVEGLHKVFYQIKDDERIKRLFDFVEINEFLKLYRVLHCNETSQLVRGLDFKIQELFEWLNKNDRIKLITFIEDEQAEEVLSKLTPRQREKVKEIVKEM